ncbi:hypothetical protein CHS0354_006311, partial [Potamilus streckersoni]
MTLQRHYNDTTTTLQRHYNDTTMTLTHETYRRGRLASGQSSQRFGSSEKSTYLGTDQRWTAGCHLTMWPSEIKTTVELQRHDDGKSPK